jgi:phytoene dehydrogenase-like protein
MQDISNQLSLCLSSSNARALCFKQDYSRWPELARDRTGYGDAKRAAAEPLMKAVRSVIPDLDARLQHEHAFVKLGSPLTHERFCRRYRGSYGPGIPAGKGEFPWPADNPVKQFLHVGDSVFPGIGVPAAAVSGIIAATSLVSISDHNKLIDRVFPIQR